MTPARQPLGVCVYCGSRPGAHPSYEQQARALGTALGQCDLPLVYGGGHVGMMGAIADAALAAGGTAVGVIPRAMVEREWAHQGLSELLIVEDMHQRKATMAQRARCYVALPGGFGTLEELSETLSWAQLDFHQKPLFLLNVRGYFDPLLAFLDRCVGEHFADTAHRQLLQVTNSVDDLLAHPYFPAADHT